MAGEVPRLSGRLAWKDPPPEAAARPEPARPVRLISAFVDAIEIMPFDQSAASRFATVAAALVRRGEPIGTFDTLMAAHALSLRLTFVTHNTRHFARGAGLRQTAGSDSVSRRTAASSGPRDAGRSA